jgi:hypothetical protein
VGGTFGTNGGERNVNRLLVGKPEVKGPLGGPNHKWRNNVSPVRYELSFYIPEDDILHSHCRENLKSYIALTGWTL